MTKQLFFTKIGVLFLSTFFSFSAISQNNSSTTNSSNDSQTNQNYLPNRGCGSGILPLQFETWLQNITPTTQRLSGGQTQSVFNIPVIVHVIHNNEALNSVSATSGGNLNAAQIQDQINILNKDFNGLNPDTSLIPSAFKPVLGKFQFNFCLAVVNPTGGVLAEPGIDRVNRTTISPSFTAPPYGTAYIDATIKPATIWNPNKYMNMWVLALGNSLLGYATFPNPGTSGLPGITGGFGSATTDGLVMLNSAFGSTGTAQSGVYNKGRTAVHEIGHWLGLRHIWGDGTVQCGASDYCTDTPPQQGGTASPIGSNYGCPTYPLHANTCTLSGLGNPNGDMFMNYMDYTNDACMYMFTNDQKNRAQLIMTNSPMRASLLTSTVCNSPTAVDDIGILYVTSPTYSQNIICSSAITPSIAIFNYGTNTITSSTFSYNVSGAGAGTYTWTGNLAPSASLIISMPAVSVLTNGAKVYNVGAYLPNGNTDPNMNNNNSNQPFTISGQMSLTATPNTTICSGNSFTLTASGGTSYTWQPGSWIQSNYVVTPTISTVYTLSATNGTCPTTQTISITLGGAAATFSVNSASICSGGTATLTAVGAPNYTWSTASNSNSITVSPTVTTVYTVTGSSGACASSTTTTVFVTAAPSISLSSSAGTNICVASSTTLTASGTSCNYTWMPSGATGSVINLVPSTSVVYSVFANCGGCSGVSSITLNVSPAPNLAIFASNYSLCSGNSAVLTGSGASSYTWNTGSNSNSISVTPGSTAGYTLFGNNGGCTGYTITTINVNPSVNLSVSNQTICTGGSATVQAPGATNYTWSNGPTTASFVVTPTTSATYTVIGSTGFCSDTKTLSVTLGTFFTIPISGPNVICGGGSATLTASGGITYTWSTASNNNSITVNPSVTTIYSVTGSNGTCNGVGIQTVSIGANPTIAISNGTAITICSGGSITLNATGGTTYTWNTSATGSQISVAPTTNTSYIVVGSNTAGCTNTAAINVSVGGTAIAVSISASNSFVCSGANVTLTANGASNYTWSNGATTSSVVVTPTVNTSYSVNGSNGGCNGTATQSVFILNANPMTVSVSPSKTVCLGNSVSLFATGSFTSFTWSGQSTTGNSIVITPTTSAFYTVTGNAGLNSCSNQTVINILVGASPQSIITTTNSSCGNLCTGKMNITSSGGKTPYTYSLSGSTCTSSACNSLCVGLYTVYTRDSLGCKSLNIFSIANSANNLLATLNTTHATCPTCTDGVLAVNMSGGASPYTYTWTPVSGSTSVLNNLSVGCYSVDVKDASGCTTKAWACIGVVVGINGQVFYPNELLVYPNPAKEFLNVQLNGYDFNYVMFNSLGQKIAQEKNNKNLAKLDMQQYAKGIYVLEISVGEAVMHLRVVKE